MSNKDVIEKKVKTLGYKLGCYNTLMDKLTKSQLNKVLDMLQLEYTDVDVILNRKKYIVEIATVDNEKDFEISSKEEYQEKYGKEDEIESEAESFNTRKSDMLSNYKFIENGKIYSIFDISDDLDSYEDELKELGINDWKDYNKYTAQKIWDTYKKADEQYEMVLNGLYYDII